MIKHEDRLLATHISGNTDFTAACQTGNAELIRAIVN